MNQKVEASDNDDEDVMVEDEIQADDAPSAESADESDESDNDEVLVSIGEDAPPPDEPAHAPEWVRELRKTNRELQRQNRELQGKLQTTTTETKPVVLGKKPSLEDYDYDADKFEEALTTWFER